MFPSYLRPFENNMIKVNSIVDKKYIDDNSRKFKKKISKRINLK